MNSLHPIFAVDDLDFFNPYQNLFGEIWENVEFTDKPYVVSNYGRLKSFCYNKETILRGRLTGNSLTFDARINGAKQNIFIHKLVADFFLINDDPKNKTHVVHLDHNYRNNMVTNLKWVDRKELFNYSEKFNPNLTKFRNNRPSKISENDVKVIRDYLKKGVTGVFLAKHFGISEMQITRIKRNENWVK